MSNSPKVGGPGGTPYSYTCPGSAYVDKISGRSGDWMDGLSIHCSDGSQSPWFGGQGGAPWDIPSTDGFSGWGEARAGDYVDRIQFKQANGTLATAYGGMGGAPVAAWSCPTGQKVYQISGGSGGYLDSFQLACRPPATASTPTVSQPTTSTPTSTPTVNQPTTSTPTVNQPTVSQPAASGDSSMMWLFLFLFIMFIFIALGALVMRRGSRSGAYDMDPAELPM